MIPVNTTAKGVNRSMAQQVFKRIEKKYMLTRPQREALLQAFQGHMRRDEFGRHTICNLYLDTDDYALTRRSIEKPVYKEKLRLRAYGVPGPGDTVFLELKKKYKGVVHKRRMELTCQCAMDWLLRGKHPDADTQIARELDYALRLYRPQPKVYLCYDREAYFCPDNPDLRITLDENIRFRTAQIDLTRGAWGTSTLPEGATLMEIKIPGAMPLWLAGALSAQRVYPCSYSKVGTVYENYIQPAIQLGGFQPCSQVS